MGYSEPVNEQEEESSEETVDTATELASQMKSIASSLKTPSGQKGLDKKEIEMFSTLINAIIEALKNDNATSLLTKLTNLAK